MEWLLFGGAFLAGMLDAVVGGGGLIQIPLLFSLFPGSAPATIFGTNKLSSVFGTASAAFRLSRRVDFPWRLAAPAAAAACVMAYLGAMAVAWMPPETLRPLVLVLLVLVGAYTFARKDLGVPASRGAASRSSPAALVGTGGAIGFYDGFFGPGTGSFLIFAYVRFFRLDFLQASAAAKVVNVATNLAALAYFLPQAAVLWREGLGMAVFNVLGAVVGAQLAIKGGAGLVRKIFLVVVFLIILKFANDTIN